MRIHCALCPTPPSLYLSFAPGRCCPYRFSPAKLPCNLVLPSPFFLSFTRYDWPLLRPDALFAAIAGAKCHMFAVALESCLLPRPSPAPHLTAPRCNTCLPLQHACCTAHPLAIAPHVLLHSGALVAYVLSNMPSFPAPRYPALCTSALPPSHLHPGLCHRTATRCLAHSSFCKAACSGPPGQQKHSRRVHLRHRSVRVTSRVVCPGGRHMQLPSRVSR